MREKRLRLFVYGTLKKGFANHRRYCLGYHSVESAWIPGKLYTLPAGYPALLIPDAAILTGATANPHQDVWLQQEWRRSPPAPSLEDPAPGWSKVQGEIFTFGDPVSRLAAIDRLEGFDPGKPSHYLRVLSYVQPAGAPTPITAWLYVMPNPGAGARFLDSGCWP